MKRHYFIAFVLLGLVLASGCVQQGAKEQKNLSTNINESQNFQFKEFNLDIKRTGFFPSTITVFKGDHVRIYAKAEYDPGVTHSFTIDEFNINAPVTAKLTGERTDVIEFVADKPGIFTYYCGMCPKTYPRISGQLVVKEEGE